MMLTKGKVFFLQGVAGRKRKENDDKTVEKGRVLRDSGRAEECVAEGGGVGVPVSALKRKFTE